MDFSDASSRIALIPIKEYVSMEDMASVFPRSRFLTTYRRHQNFAFPLDSIIYYVIKSPSSTKAYQKLIQSCKYFFVQNPIIVVSHLSFKYQLNNFNVNFDNRFIKEFHKISSKIWITDILIIENPSDFNEIENHLSTNIIPKIYQCDVKHLFLEYQIITFNDFHFLASNCTNLYMLKVTVKAENGTIIPLERLFEALSNITGFHYKLPKNTANIITSKTARKLLKTPHFSNLEFINLSELPKIFDIDSFYAYIKINKTLAISFYFNGQLSDAYKTHLQMILNEILQADTHEIKVPYITFAGMDEESHKKLLNHFIGI